MSTVKNVLGELRVVRMGGRISIVLFVSQAQSFKIHNILIPVKILTMAYFVSSGCQHFVSNEVWVVLCDVNVYRAGPWRTCSV